MSTRIWIEKIYTAKSETDASKITNTQKLIKINYTI